MRNCGRLLIERVLINSGFRFVAFVSKTDLDPILDIGTLGCERQKSTQSGRCVNN